MFSSTINCLSNFILLENFFCINRSHLIVCPKKRFLGHSIFAISFSSFVTILIFDILTSDVDLGERAFQLFLFLEFLAFVVTARIYNYNALKKLDEKCLVEDDYFTTLHKKSFNFTILVATGAIIDVVASATLKVGMVEVIMFCAQDSEMIFMSLIADSITLRLSTLKEAPPVFGSRVYRHVLVTTTILNEEVVLVTMISLAVVLGTTVTYFSVIILSLANINTYKLAYLLWREVKVFFCLWRVCFATTRCKTVCQQLQFHLARRLALQSGDNSKLNPSTVGVLSRWYTAVLSVQPCFLTGSVITIGLSIPLHILDLSINYILIIVQIYVAYN